MAEQSLKVFVTKRLDFWEATRKIQHDTQMSYTISAVPDFNVGILPKAYQI